MTKPTKKIARKPARKAGQKPARKPKNSQAQRPMTLKEYLEPNKAVREGGPRVNWWTPPEPSKGLRHFKFTSKGNSRGAAVVDNVSVESESGQERIGMLVVRARPDMGRDDQIWAERGEFAGALVRERWPEQFDPRQEAVFPAVCLDPEDQPPRFYGP